MSPVVPDESARQLSLVFAYQLWLGSWETALSALATATQSRTLSTNEAAGHKAIIATEREVVTKAFTTLLGPRPTRDGATAEGSFAAAAEAVRAGWPIGVRTHDR